MKKLKKELNKWQFIFSYDNYFATYIHKQFIFGIFKLISFPSENCELSKQNYKGFLFQYKFIHPLSKLRIYLKNIKMKKDRQFYVVPNQPYTSKTKMGLCKNTKCTNKRRTSSAYCQECSDNYKKIMNTQEFIKQVISDKKEGLAGIEIDLNFYKDKLRRLNKEESKESLQIKEKELQKQIEILNESEQDILIKIKELKPSVKPKIVDGKEVIDDPEFVKKRNVMIDEMNKLKDENDVKRKEIQPEIKEINSKIAKIELIEKKIKEQELGREELNIYINLLEEDNEELTNKIKEILK